MSLWSLALLLCSLVSSHWAETPWQPKLTTKKNLEKFISSLLRREAVAWELPSGNAQPDVLGSLVCLCVQLQAIGRVTIPTHIPAQFSPQYTTENNRFLAAPRHIKKINYKQLSMNRQLIRQYSVPGSSLITILCFTKYHLPLRLSTGLLLAPGEERKNLRTETASRKFFTSKEAKLIFKKTLTGIPKHKSAGCFLTRLYCRVYSRLTN